MIQRDTPDETNSLETLYNKNVLVRFVNSGGLERLPKELRTILLLFMEGKSTRSIARRRHISHVAVQKKLKKAGELLQSDVGRWLL